MKLFTRVSVVAVGFFAIAVVFQNCSPVKISSSDAASTALGTNSDGTNSPSGDSGTDGSGSGSGSGTGTGSGSGTGSGTGSETNDPSSDPNSSVSNKSASFTFNAERMVDIMLVIDTSTSMKRDGEKLAAKLSGFITDLRNRDFKWQMCVLTTDMITDQGKSHNWSQLNKAIFSSADADQLGAASNDVFRNTISGFFQKSGDGNERAISALNSHVSKNATHNCYRAGALTMSIILSDEDESSFGGRDFNFVKSLVDDHNTIRPSDQWYAHNTDTNMDGKKDSSCPLDSSDKDYDGNTSEVDPKCVDSWTLIQNSDKPETYLSAVRTLQYSMGRVANIIVNSIIVDTDACRRDDNQTTGQTDSIAVVGTFYKQLSQLTQGSVGSICASDYSPILTNFAGRIEKATQELQLLCVPLAGSIQVSSPTRNYPNDFDYVQNGNRLVFSSAGTGQFSINVKYTCP